MLVMYVLQVHAYMLHVVACQLANAEKETHGLMINTSTFPLQITHTTHDTHDQPLRVMPDTLLGAWRYLIK